jgi:hypothetical protein
MIQRKQTIFLLVAFVAIMVCMCSKIATITAGMQEATLYNLWLTDGQGAHNFSAWPLMALLMVSAVTTLATIFLYAKRLLQAKCCLALILLLVLWYVFLAVVPQQLGGEPLWHWPAVMPAVAIVCIFFARKGIMADEKLVRSLDRIR